MLRLIVKENNETKHRNSSFFTFLSSLNILFHVPANHRNNNITHRPLLCRMAHKDGYKKCGRPLLWLPY